MILCRKEFTTEEISQIRDIIAEKQHISRGQLSRQVCERLNWRSANGKLKEMSCRVALLRMHRQGCINLPPAQERRWLNYPKRCDDKHLSACNAQAGEQESEAIECDLSELGEIRIIKVSSRYSKSHGQGHLYEYLQTKEVVGVQTVRVPRKQNQPSREAKLETRCAVLAKETEVSDLSAPTCATADRCNAQSGGVEALEWMLLTTCEVKTFEQAVEKLQWYCIRWGIEIYHRVLKSGCRIEQRQLGSAERIESCLAIDMVVAWRIFYLTKLGRETPDVPCTVFFEDAEWKVLVAHKYKDINRLKEPPSLREAIRLTASLGGFLGRKCDGEPGIKSLWLRPPSLF